MRNLLVLAAILITLLCMSVFAQAGTTIITQLLPSSPTPVAGSWYQSDVRVGGTASIVSLTGLGGNLESGQPLPTGAAKLTTDFTNAAKAEVGTFDDFGLASWLSDSSFSVGYDYYKQTVAGGNAYVAPSIKLTIYAAGGTGDNYGTLVYEPSWNIAGTTGSTAVPTDEWRSVSINNLTGAGADGYGGWWWNGGFEQPNGGGGTPIRSLSEWVSAFQSSDATDFANAHIIGLSMGVGTYNQGQIGYFDNVSIKVGNIDVVYDFEKDAPAAVPEPATLLGFGIPMLMVGLGKLKSLRK